MQHIPEVLTKPTPPPSAHEIEHERQQLKWFMMICLILLLLTVGTNFILGFYGNPTTPPGHNPLVQVTPKPTLQIILPVASPPITSSPKISSIPTIIPTKAATTAGGTRMCPMDAKMCPDGKTFVGRVSPNCEFAACPTAKK
jgi:hypothetical protein